MVIFSSIIYQLAVILGLANLAGFILVGWDKNRSLKQEERLPEALLFFSAVLFGSLGVFLGMFIFRHKTRKIYFPLGIGLLLAQQVWLLYLLYINTKI